MANPVLINDLRRSLWRRKPVLAVALMAVMILALTFLCLFLLSQGSTSDWVHAPLWRFPDLVLPIIAPAFAAGAFAKEYEQRTWQDVLLTRLTVGEILGGKFIACFIPALVTLIVVFPPFALLLLLQRVDWAVNSGNWIAPYAIKFFISLVFYLLVGLVCSYHSASARAALVVCYVSLFSYALVNFLAWTYVLLPAMSHPVYTADGKMIITDMYSQRLRPWDVSQGWHISQAEVWHLVQSLVLSVGLAAYLIRRLQGGRLRGKRSLPFPMTRGKAPERRQGFPINP